MKHVLFIVTSTSITGSGRHTAGYEFSEIADPYFEFIANGIAVDFASILGGTPPYVGYNPEHNNSRHFKESTGFKRLNFSHKLSNIDIAAYDGVFFPGGLGLMTDMFNNLTVKEVVRNTYETGKVIGAVCHGPTALLNCILSNGRNLLHGKTINAFTREEERLDNHLLDEVIPFMLEDELKRQGAVFEHTTPFAPYVVNDGMIVTGQNPASAAGVASRMIELL